MNPTKVPPARPLDVWFVCNAWTGGGAERVTSTLVQHLDRDLVRPSVCLLRNDVSYPMPEDISVHHLGYRGLPTFITAARRLHRLIDTERPDVVVSTVNANALLTGVALRHSSHRPPWIARIGSSPRNLDRGLRGFAARILYRGADRIVVNSKRLADAVAEVYPFLEGRITTILNPCDFDLIDRQASEPSPVMETPPGPLLIAAGRLSQAKRFDVMLEAFAIVRRTTDATLWVCGEGPLRKTLERQTVQLELEGSIQWFGFQTNPYALMCRADVFVLTSEFEGLPNSLIEAQGLGVPAVSTDCPTGPEEIIEHGATGLLVPVGDVRAIAAATLEIISDEEGRRRMGAAARQHARALFDHAKIVRQWENMLNHWFSGVVR